MARTTRWWALATDGQQLTTYPSKDAYRMARNNAETLGYDWTGHYIDLTDPDNRIHVVMTGGPA